MRDIASQLEGFRSPFVARRWSPGRLFSDGGNGIFWDFTRTIDLFTDAAGTVVLTTSGQTIGLVKDASRSRSPITAYAGGQATAGLRPQWLGAPTGHVLLDGVDDLLSTVLTLAQTGDVMIFGRNGSWVETGRVYLAGATFAVGPKDVSGLATLNLLTALGGIVGVVALGRASTAIERAAALRYFMLRGAAGWLAASGADLISNGTFDTIITGWSVNAAGAITSVAGQLVLTCTLASPATGTSFATAIGSPYLLTLTLANDSMTGAASVLVGTALANGSVLTTVMGSAATYTYAFVATATTTWVSMSGDATAVATQTMTFDNVTCKLLVAA